jgi:hypothetical protein
MYIYIAYICRKFMIRFILDNTYIFHSYYCIPTVVWLYYNIMYTQYCDVIVLRKELIFNKVIARRSTRSTAIIIRNRLCARETTTRTLRTMLFRPARLNFIGTTRVKNLGGGATALQSKIKIICRFPLLLYTMLIYFRFWAKLDL